ncbi:Methyltransferase type 11 [Kribbella flavida DSM 17836]|uniref:Methyltransferase type 11 n=1 Tax=Kribbella flavida (strain DSM 17836 / JCM 10339 / NBRC 14399) TaxID=479435 RepID=D2Q2Z5_KRIFD|nr:methyltransferase domain-containing protein [Kribbella flavida]ADB32120.1 Methyltransferase type 11 [Kribbella flavida DSM 17836]
MDDTEELVRRWRAEETGPPGGWDFSALDGRVREPELPWDFDAVTRECLAQASAVLDMGTGGGERLLRFSELLPSDTTATEGWPPNLPIAREALAPYGIEVVAFGQPDDEPRPVPMPFAAGRFDLVVNRHESYHPDEVARVLAAGGVFLTQQVGGDEFGEVREAFGVPAAAAHVQYTRFRSALAAAGLDVLHGAESIDHYVFTDVAALVAYLQLVPWEVPDDFSVDRYADTLLALHARGPAAGEPLLVTRKRFWLMARKSG